LGKFVVIDFDEQIWRKNGGEPKQNPQIRGKIQDLVVSKMFEMFKWRKLAGL